MTSLARRVARALRESSLLPAGERVVVAVSGGADSVALAWLLHELAHDAAWQVAGLVHVHHGLRPDEADADAAFCQALGARLGWLVETVRVDAARHARETTRSIEAAARDLRYAACRDALARLGGTVIATGHTLDDQAETVLLRLLRGAGTRGLAGIRPRRGDVVRPVLACRRADLRQYLLERGETYREDSSNADRSIPRNRVRHDLLPVIERVAPGGIRALARCAGLAADDEAWLEAAAVEALAGVRIGAPTPDAASVDLDAVRLAALAPALARRLVRHVAEPIAGTAWTARHIDDVVALSRAGSSQGHLDLPRAVVTRAGGRVTIRRVRPGDPVVDAAPPRMGARPLPVPGELAAPELGVTISATRKRTADAGISSEQDRVVVQASALALPLAVRTRRPGDRIRPLGAPGSRKLQDVLIDRKVARGARDRVPIVVDADDRIIWVAGVALAHDCRVTEAHKEVVVLELKR